MIPRTGKEADLFKRPIGSGRITGPKRKADPFKPSGSGHDSQGGERKQICLKDQ